ncbi:hypothetical protein FPOAC1_003115 [Fusarium poae]|uniref:hypothetical protein n=1 Tax=Fusarium poae TaxID=36050 RepID=UPI001CEA18AB|nr:hypothetical protein FPOAC1_003115 [Fusarium poae]KAG8677104.1 hypothetical protein FPOAC1_003115 [Fusarium poae]
MQISTTMYVSYSPWSLSIGFVTQIRSPVRFTPLELVVDLPGPLSIHVQVALAVTLGLASILYPVVCRGIVH